VELHGTVHGPIITGVASWLTTVRAWVNAAGPSGEPGATLKRMARVLFTSVPAYGHVLPMLPLIRAAERAGHDVRIATGPDLLAPLTSRGLDVLPVGPTFAESWAAHEAVWADPRSPDEQKMMDGVVALFGEPAIARYAELVAMSREWRPDVVVHEVLEAGGSLLARDLGVPGVVHGFGPMFASYAELIDWTGAALGEPGLWAQAASENAVDICPPSLQPVDGPPPWPRATPLRPTAGEPGNVPPHVAEVLASDGQVAYFTLGTVKNTETADFTTGLTALEDYDGVVIATTGRPLGPDELGPLPANVVVADFVPQADVFERADLVVSHCGSGTMLGGLANGVPQVALPRGTDQPQNAALLAQAGAGVVVGPEDFAVEIIRSAVSEVTSDRAYRAAAERVRDEIAAMPDADTVWADLAV
jgi:UDP:flavonoid glycosyltransferase YjiC (YdhE family)